MKPIRNRQRTPLYMGVDIEEGSPQGGRKPLYSVVIINEEGKIIEKQNKAPLSRVIRLAWYYKPVKIAFDNILEIASSKKDLHRILDLFPTESEIVQVTIGKEGSTSISRLAAPYRVIVGYGKLTPGKTAYLVAMLAANGRGISIRRIEQKTLILVTKNRKSGPGGFSQQRYQRRIRAAILNATMRIKQALDDAGYEYDLKYRKSEGGLDSATFTVYVTRDKLRGIVKPYRGPDYSIVIKPVYRTILSLPERTERSSLPIIVGIDPGITTGIAIIDLNGNVLFLDSSKTYDRGLLLEKILQYGKPVIISVDVPDPPETVRKIASLTGALLYTPPGEMTIVEKRNLAQKALNGTLPDDSHQRDALAAAFKAYLSLTSKLDHIESQLKRIGLDIDHSVIKEAVIRGVTVAEALEYAIEKELETILSKTEIQTDEKKTPRHIEEQSKIPEITDRTQTLEAEIIILKERIRRLQKEKETLQYELERKLSQFKSEIYRDTLINKMEAQLEILNKELEALKEKVNKLKEQNKQLENLIKEIYEGSYILAYRLRSLTTTNIKNILNQTSLTGEIIYLDTPTFEPDTLNHLAQQQPLGIIVKGNPDITTLRKILKPFLIPVINETELGTTPFYTAIDYVILNQKIRELLAIKKKQLEEEYFRKISLERLITEYRKRRMKNKSTNKSTLQHDYTANSNS